MEPIGNFPLASVNEQPKSTENILNFRIDFKFFQNWKKLCSYGALRFLSLALSLAIVGVAGEALAARPGAQGANVTNIQSCLRRLGYFNGPVTGRFGSQTESAVRRFQQANRLPAIGVVGPQTQRLLQQQCQARSGGSVNSSGLKLGSRGPAVRRLQEDLRSLRFYYAPITGYFGQETQQAVIRFQQSYGLRPDGVVGSSTLNSIRIALGRGNGSAIGGEPDSFPNALNLGDKGPEVSELQAALVQLRYLAPGNNTGYFGSITRDAVARFQRDYQLRVSGIADTQTLTAISRALRGQAPGGPGFPPGGNSNCSQSGGDICIGETSQRVSMLQQRLQQLGFFRGDITGYFGTATRDAVLQFQRYYQLNPTGVVDFQTWQALNNNSNPPTGTNVENRYVVVVPITDGDTLNRVRQFVPSAFSAQSRLGDYVNAGAYRERADAESISRQLRNQGLDARVEYF